jgi:NhaC family Na+:H+ antiporter
MNECLSKSEKALSFGLAVIPILAMLLLLIIGYGIMGLRIEPLLLCSAAVAAGMALVARVLLGRHH